jgi:hypothetical protein
MAMTRSELKDIIKECILEVMLEGIRPGERSEARQVHESSRKPEPMLGKRDAQQIQSMGKKHLDSMTFGQGAARVAEQAQGRRAAPPAAPSPAISQLASEFPKEQRGIMADIFADTARNTLPAQLTAERNPAAALSQISGASEANPMDLFEGSTNWADLAFAPSKKK